MKKILFASTALVAAGVMGAGTASASEKINLQLGGFSKWWVVGAWNNTDFMTKGGASANTGNNNGDPVQAIKGTSYNNVNVKGDNEVWFGGNTTLDNGLKVGVDIHLEAGGHTDMTTDTIDKSYVYVEGGFGKFLVGTQKNGTYLLHVNAPDAAGNWGEGGILSGGYSIVVPSTVNMMAGGNTTAINTTNNSEAITYVAPTFYGLTVGGSYLPHGGFEDKRSNADLNAVVTNLNSGAGDIQQVYGAGALYANTFGGVGVKVSAGAVTGKFSSGINATWLEQAYGTQLSYAGFTLGGSYRHQQANYNGGNDAGQALDLANLGNITSVPGSAGNGRSWDIGLSYATGPYAVSFTYYNSHVAHSDSVSLVNANTVNDGDDMIDIYQVSGKYNLGAGVDVLASAGYLVANSSIPMVASGGDANHNSGWAVMSGLSLAF